MALIGDYDAVGSPDGSRFRKFVQGITLEHLVRLSNDPLSALGPRYQLAQGRVAHPLISPQWSGAASFADVGAALAERFGIAYSVPAEHRRYYEGILVNIPFVNSGGTYANASEESWRLPLPAVFVVRQDGTIAFSEGYADFRVRPEPSDAMDALTSLVGHAPHPSR
jgi:hypothetical protein